MRGFPSHLLGDEVRGLLYCFGDLKALPRDGKEVDEESLGRLNVVSLVLVVVQFWMCWSIVSSVAKSAKTHY